MIKQENDTTDPESEDDQKPEAHSYYYDDSTGYEVYEPAKAPEGDEFEE